MITDWGDIGEINGGRLLELVLSSTPGSSFVDVGVRGGVTSKIFLEESEKRTNLVVGIDVMQCPKDLVGNPSYRFIQGDSVTVLRAMTIGGPPWLPWLFKGAVIDTLHISEQVMCELIFLWEKIEIGGFVAFHDTAWPEWKHDYYLGKLWDRPEVGIERFFRGAGESIRIEHNPDSYGMTIVHKLDGKMWDAGIDWRTVFDARNELLELLPEGCLKKKM